MDRRVRHDKQGHPRHLRADQRGTLQVVETLVVALFVVVAVVAVSSMNVPVTETEGFKKDNEQMLEDSLRALSQRPSTVEDGTLFGSKLEEHVLQSLAGDSGPLMRYLNKTLPTGASYNVLLDNGYGAPFPLVNNGAPPRESVAGSAQFVPKLAYTFIVPEFAYYHGDFHQNILALPISHGILHTDEGNTVELAVTFQRLDDGGNLKGGPVTMKTYGQTALRFNDATARQWPSVTTYHDPDKTAVDDETHYLDLSEYTIPANITFQVGLTETANVKVPKNTDLTISFPRGWSFNTTALNDMRNQEYLGNKDRWKDIEIEGNSDVGSNITARLREPFQNEEVHFGVNVRFGVIIDTAYPFFQPITVTLGNGTQGQTTIVAEPPALINTGVFRREAYLSMPKPMISGDGTLWGVGFTNKGETVEIKQVDLRQPQGVELMTAVGSHESWIDGTWVENTTAPAHWTWKPTNTAEARISTGEAAYMTLDITAGVTNDNSYRNQDDQKVMLSYDPRTGDGINTLDDWVYKQRLFRMSEEWVYKDGVPPYDEIPGWPDETGQTYVIGGATHHLRKELRGKAEYTVMPAGLTSNTFGDYQGSHVFSQLDIVGPTGQPQRGFELGEKTTLKNDFSTMLGDLSTLNAVPLVDVSDYEIRTMVYTPERAWKGLPTKTFTQSAQVSTAIGAVAALESGDLNGDGTMDVIAIGTTGTIYAMDGRDGAKFWTHSTTGTVTSTALSDLDGDGIFELVVGLQGPSLTIINTDTTLPDDISRTLATENVGPITLTGTGAYSVDGIEHHGAVPDGSRLVVATSARLLDAMVLAVDVTQSGGTWTITKPGISYRNTETVTNTDVRIADLEPVTYASSGSAVRHYAIGSHNGTVSLLDGTTLQMLWITPIDDVPIDILPVDLDGDADDDLVVDTARASNLVQTGRYTHLLDGSSGRIASSARTVVSDTADPDPFAVLWRPDGGVIVTSRDAHIIQDSTGLYKPELSWASSDVNVANDLGLAPSTDYAGIQHLDGTTHLISLDGDIIAEQGAPAFGDYYEWSPILAGPGASGDAFLGGWLHPDFANDLDGWLLRESGALQRIVDGVYEAPVTQVCSHASVPDAGATCTADAVTIDHAFTSAADGTLTGAYILHDGDGIANAAARPTLYHYDVATADWTTIRSWANEDLNSMQLTDDGRIWVGGRKADSSGPYASMYTEGSGWADASFSLLTVGQSFLDVREDSSGTVFAVTAEGSVLVRSGDTDWHNRPVAGLGALTKAVIFEDPDGGSWVIGNDFVHAPLFTYERDAVLLFEDLFADLSGAGHGLSQLEVTAMEGWLGGSVDANQRSLTRSTFEYRKDGGAWTPMGGEDKVENPSAGQRSYSQAITCATVAECQNIDLRVTLRSRTISDALAPMRQDAGSSPLVGELTVRIGDGVSSTAQSLPAEAGVAAAGTTATLSKTQTGYVLPKATSYWSHRGLPSDGPQADSVKERFVAVAPDGFRSDATGAQLVILDRADAQHIVTLFEADGDTVPTALGGLTFLGSGDDVMLVEAMDATTGSTTDLTMVGTFDAIDGLAARIWDLESGTVHDAPGDTASTTAYAMVPTGRSQGRDTFAVAGDSDEVRMITSPFGAHEPAVKWAVEPGTAQGLATFEYEIPSTALYGTAMVVSELTFNVMEGGAQITQTARLVDWFNIVPPGRELPNPPVYTIEVVSWFNEG